MLAAGRGRRLGGNPGGDSTEGLPKVLLRFAGRTLLDRHLERLSQAGAGPVHLVVGYQAPLIEAELHRLDRLDVTLIHNPDWHEGSIVSLDAGHAVMQAGGPVVLMDADVIYGQALIEKLFRSQHDVALLLDPELEPGDEPVKICVDAQGRIVDFAKRPEAAHEWHGESVGFFRFSPDVATRLSERVRAMVSEPGGRALEYEEPIRALIREDAERATSSATALFGFEDVGGLPWTEIDFMEDIAKAEALLPILDGAPA